MPSSASELASEVAQVRRSPLPVSHATARRASSTSLRISSISSNISSPILRSCRNSAIRGFCLFCLTTVVHMDMLRWEIIFSMICNLRFRMRCRMFS